MRSRFCYSCCTAALLTKLGIPSDQKTRDNLVATVATLAALLTTLNATLKFNQKWIANRDSRAAAYDLKIQLSSASANLDEIQKKFTQTVDRHEEMITK